MVGIPNAEKYEVWVGSNRIHWALNQTSLGALIPGQAVLQLLSSLII